MKLKNCPFCGTKPYINNSWHGSTSTSIKCKGCGCTTQIENGEQAAIAVWNNRSAEIPRPLDQWHEDYGDALWWKIPIEEPPYCGSSLDSNWIDDYYTHWTSIIYPNQSK